VGILFITCEADCVSTTTRSDVGRVGADHYDAIIDAGQVVLLRSIAIDKVHVSVCGVVELRHASIMIQREGFSSSQPYSIETEHGKEIIPAVIILDGISCKGDRSQSSAKECRKKMHMIVRSDYMQTNTKGVYEKERYVQGPCRESSPRKTSYLQVTRKVGRQEKDI